MMAGMNRSRTDPKAFEQYMRWGMLLVAFLPALATLGAFGQAPGWGAIALVVSAAFGAVAFWSCWRMLDACVGANPWAGTGRPLLWLAVATVASTGILFVGWRMFPQEAALWLWPPLVALSVVALAFQWWMAIAVGVVAAGVGILTVIFVVGETGAYGSLYGLWAALLPLMVFTAWASAWMLRIMFDLQEARDAASWLAVNEERARISRDLHDLFGQTLSTIAVKSELAAELAARGRSERAEAEMRQVHRIARESGQKVRSVVRGDRALDLSAEVVGARAVLGAAGIDCQLSVVDVDDEDAATTLAWVLRESVTNILRHSDATRVVIDLSPSGLVLRNDGAPEVRGAAGGLNGMATRMVGIGGELHWDHQGDEFVVDARLPGVRTATEHGPGADDGGMDADTIVAASDGVDEQMKGSDA